MLRSRVIQLGAPHKLPQNGFSQVNVLVVGDLMLDRYIDGEVHRISPEAPVPVLTVRSKRYVPGGASNVASNVIGLNADVAIAGVIGTDPEGEALLAALTQCGANVQCVIRDCSRCTTVKTRITAGNHQIVRIDEEISDPLQEACERELIVRITSWLNQHTVHVVILSDYRKGVLSKYCLQILIAECKRLQIPVLVDPKREDYGAYKGATCITPNHKEFLSAISHAGIRGEFSVAGSTFCKELECATLLVTQGSAGMTLFTQDHAQHLPALAEEVFDVCGAGDTVIATLGTAIGSGLTFQWATEIANVAASLVVKRVGTTAISWRELYESLRIWSTESGARNGTISSNDVDGNAHYSYQNQSLQGHTVL